MQVMILIRDSFESEVAIMRKYTKFICAFLILICLSFSGCTDKQDEKTPANTSGQESGEDTEIQEDSQENVETPDDSDADAGSGVTVEDSEDVPDVEVEFSE